MKHNNWTKKDWIFLGIFIVIIVPFSIFNTGYTSPEQDDESSAYLSMANLKKDPELYKNDFYVQSLKKIPADPFTPIAQFYEPSIPQGDWGEVILFGLETEKDDLFVIPVFAGKYDYSTFRFLAGRAVFLEWKGTGTSAYDASLISEIQKRFIDYCKIDFMKVKDRKELVETCKSNYLNFMEEDDFKLLNAKYGADFLIENKIETPRRLKLPIVLENEEFIIYYLGEINEEWRFLEN